MAKATKTSSPKFVDAGPPSGMQTRHGVNTQTPGGTGRQYGGKGGKWAEGGKGGMHTRSTVTTRRPGGTGGQ